MSRSSIISRTGALTWGSGKGYRTEEFTGFNLARHERSARLAEGVSSLHRLWTEERVTFAGQFTQITHVHIQPEPVQKPHPPLWIGARTDKALARAARDGYHLHLTIGPDLVPRYHELLRMYGRNPADFSTSHLHFVSVAPTEEEAWEDIQEQAHWMMQTYARWFRTGGDVVGDDCLWTITEAKAIRHAPIAQRWLIGPPEQVAPKVEALLKHSPLTHFVMGMQLPGVDPRKGTRSMELFAKEIMPGLRKSLGE